MINPTKYERIGENAYLKLEDGISEIISISDPVAISYDKCVVSAILKNVGEKPETVTGLHSPDIDWGYDRPESYRPMCKTPPKILVYSLTTSSGASVRNGSLVVNPGETITIWVTMSLPYEVQEYLRQKGTLKGLSVGCGFYATHSFEAVEIYG